MLSENIEIKAMSHITGGGIPENLDVFQVYSLYQSILEIPFI